MQKKSEKINKEILYHHNFLNWLDKAKMGYDTWGSSGPDVIFDDYSLLGEFKIKENKTSYKEAFIEIQKRKKAEFDINNFKNFFILTKDYIRVYDTKSVEWDNNDFKLYLSKYDFAQNCLVTFVNKEKDRKSFLEFVENNCNKISVDGHLSNVLDLLLSDELALNLMDAIMIISKLNDKPIYLRKVIVYNAGLSDEYSIEFKTHDDLNMVRSSLIEKYYVDNFEKVKEYIKHNYSSHLSDTKKSNLGKYYTPKFVVEYMKRMLENIITPDVTVMDIACGCGAFLEIFSDCHIIGRDIDYNAIDVLKTLGFVNIAVDNSLVNVNRDKYRLTDTDKLVIIGNPPYNDTTSKNKRFGTKRKTTPGMDIDPDIYAKDLGQSFLKAYAKLNPDYICILHPLAYLIKQSNFNSLKMFTQNYKLTRGVIFSSSNFPDLKGNTEFPVLIAFYEKGNMTYDYIKNFEFEILNNEKRYKLTNFETIDTIVNGEKYIRKYPTKKDRANIVKSDIDLYQYNIRDTNSLMSSGNLMCLNTTEDLNYVTVNFKELYKYSYLNMYKAYFKNDYLVGNLSPLININEYEQNIDLQNLMIIGTILKNRHRLSCFDYTNKNSFIYTKFLVSDFRRLSKEYKGDFNFYEAFLKIIDNEDLSDIDKIYDLISEYFYKMKINFGLVE